LLEGKGRRTPFEVWRGMGLPSYVRLSLPEWRLEEAADRLG
jgi:hypothetical protein